MNKYLIVLLTIFFIGGCVQNSKDNTHKSAKSEDWRTGQVEYQGTTSFIRYNHALTSIQKNDYPQLIRISVKFKTENPNGFPSNAEASGLWKLEDLFDESLSKTNHAVFVGTITMPNKKHFIFYSPALNSSEGTVSSLIKSIPNYEIEYSIQPDAEWNVFKGFYNR